MQDTDNVQAAMAIGVKRNILTKWCRYIVGYDEI